MLRFAKFSLKIIANPEFIIPIALRYTFDVAFICGVYKSGTSLLTKILSNSFYFDPSTITNPREHGYGVSKLRYLTRECTLIRKINENLLPQRLSIASNVLSAIKNRAYTARRSSEIADPEDYLRLWQVPIVIKDPRLVYTLPTWIAVALTLKKKVCVCFTVRSIGELTEAWMNAPFTRPLLAKKVHKNMLEWQGEQYRMCRQIGVPISVHDINSLRILDRILSELPN